MHLLIDAKLYNFHSDFENDDLEPKEATLKHQRREEARDCNFYQDDVPALDIDLEIKRCGGVPTGLGPGAVRVGPDEIDGDWQGNAPDEVSDEEEGPGGHGDDDGGRLRGREVCCYIRGQLGDPRGNLVLGPKDALYVSVHRE